MFFTKNSVGVKTKLKTTEIITQISRNIKDSSFEQKIKQESSFLVLELNPKLKIFSAYRNSFCPYIRLQTKEHPNFTYIDACFYPSKLSRFLISVFEIILSIFQLIVAIIVLSEKHAFSFPMLFPILMMVLIYLFQKALHYLSFNYYKNLIFYNIPFE